MTNSLHLPARPDAPVVCDMSSAQDTPAERLLEYLRLFETALLRRERRADSVSFWFRADPGTRKALDDLARREAACCPFLGHRVETAGDEVIWTTTNMVTSDERAAIDVLLDALHALPAALAGAHRRRRSRRRAGPARTPGPLHAHQHPVIGAAIDGDFSSTG